MHATDRGFGKLLVVNGRNAEGYFADVLDAEYEDRYTSCETPAKLYTEVS